MNWILISLFILILAIGGVVYFNQVEILNPEYQGPVPEGYDEEHFRETGETIKKEGVVIS